MDFGSVMIGVVVGMALGSFITKALFPRIKVREIEVEVKVEKQLTLLQALTLVFSSDPMQRLTLSGIGVSAETLDHVRKALDLVKEGFIPSRVGGVFQFVNNSRGVVYILSARGVWKNRSSAYMFFPTPVARREQEEPPY